MAVGAVAVVPRTRTQITRPLKVLIPLIQDDLAQGDRAGMEYYADAGDKLIEAKSQVSFGHWGAWLSKNFERTGRQAQIYMQLARARAEHAEKRTGSSFLPQSLNEFRGNAERERQQAKREKPLKAVLDSVEPDWYAQEKQTRDDEVRLHREIALQLVDAGYKALATRLHPDHGGSKEAMARLNRVRDELKGVAGSRRFV
jgi:hypothetical protein